MSGSGGTVLMRTGLMAFLLTVVILLSQGGGCIEVFRDREQSWCRCARYIGMFYSCTMTSASQQTALQSHCCMLADVGAGMQMDGTGAEIALACLQGGYKYHQYQVVGRHLPTEKEPEPTVYRMKLWATDPVRARSKFW